MALRAERIGTMLRACIGDARERMRMVLCEWLWENMKERACRGSRGRAEGAADGWEGGRHGMRSHAGATIGEGGRAPGEMRGHESRP